MRLLLLLWLSVASIQQLHAQVAKAWMDSVLQGVFLGQIPVYDTAFNLVDPTTLPFVWLDTCINDQWTRPKFKNHIFQGSFDGVLVEALLCFELRRHRQDSNFIAFELTQADDNGNYLPNKIAFLLDKRKKSLPLPSSKAPPWFSNSSWRIERIKVEEKVLTMDSCHRAFRLTLRSDFTFHQSYGGQGYICRTEKMRAAHDTNDQGIIFCYEEVAEGHFLTVQQGIWTIDKNRLTLLDTKRKKRLSFVIKRWNRRVLVMELEGSSYEITLKKVDE